MGVSLAGGGNVSLSKRAPDLTATGLARYDLTEDASSETATVLVLADGMGGHPAGEVASVPI
ncbi:hypothetical protein [Nocardia sp. NPDC060249]|uniref:hypothetical protein n=1 Tax=Nocardia sp. NPDC060249 TaxID=3347082 RepID=UPI003662BB51